MSDDVKLLSSPKNFAVVQLLERRYPGIVFQGDSLHSLVIRLKNLQQLLRNDCIDDLNIELIEICDEMAAVLNHYELVCSEQKIALPYTKNDDDPVGAISAT
ncbi:DUF6959 family protein [Undibacterium sp. TJN19]|uniref:DUF6959 family protein n=1 Tax=Undibacterium sp. TJN19 TaxID=3413055 RepID=UPI003BEF82AD